LAGQIFSCALNEHKIIKAAFNLPTSQGYSKRKDAETSKVPWITTSFEAQHSEFGIQHSAVGSGYIIYHLAVRHSPTINPLLHTPLPKVTPQWPAPIH